MSTKPSTAAAQFLTEMALRPDLSATLSDDELRIRAGYDQLIALERRREALRFELESCRALVEKVEEGLSQRVRLARFSFRRQAGIRHLLGRAA